MKHTLIDTQILNSLHVGRRGEAEKGGLLAWLELLFYSCAIICGGG